MDISKIVLPPTLPSTPAIPPPTTEIVAATIIRDLDGSPGFSIIGGQAAEPIRISSLTPGGAAERTGKLRVGDRILSVNGVNVKFARQDQVVTLLTSNRENEIYICVERAVKEVEPKPKLTPSRSLPSLYQEISTKDISNLIANVYKKDSGPKNVFRTQSTSNLFFGIENEKVRKNKWSLGCG